MSIYEALSVLGLKPRATSSEVRAAYRDLVKVWHPDRFGDDVRLRRKAEMRLQEINLAYEVLQDYEPEQRQAIKIEVVQQHNRVYPYHPKPDPPPVEPKAKAYEFVSEIKKTKKKIPYWAVGLAMVLILVSVRYGCEKEPDEEASAPVVATTPVVTAPVAKNPVVDPVPETVVEPKVEEQGADPNVATSGTASVIAPVPSPEKAVVVPAPVPAKAAVVVPAPVPAKAAVVVPAPVPAKTAAVVPAPVTKGAPPSAVPAAKEPAAPVNDLPSFAGVSPVDQSSIEAACTPQKVMRGHVAYVKCLKKQLVDLSHAPAAPDLSGLDYADREGIESACANEASLKGPSVYRACVIKKYEQKPHPIHLP